MVPYNEAELVRALSGVPAQLRVAFAAACAERLFPAYAAFSNRTGRGNPVALATILDRVWSDLLGDKMGLEQIHAELARCMGLVPGEDDQPWVEEQAYADDAASAVAFTLRALESGEPQEAAWAARRAYEALDHHVIHRLGIEAEEQVLAHPVVQAELERQHRDVDELHATRQDPASLILRLRERARAESAVFFTTGA